MGSHGATARRRRVRWFTAGTNHAARTPSPFFQTNMIDLSKTQRAAWADHVKAALLAGGADIARLSSGATRITIQGNLLVVHDLADVGGRVLNKLIHRSVG